MPGGWYNGSLRSEGNQKGRRGNLFMISKGILLMGIVNDRIDDNHNMLQKFVQFVKTCAQYEAN